MQLTAPDASLFRRGHNFRPALSCQPFRLTLTFNKCTSGCPEEEQKDTQLIPDKLLEDCKSDDVWLLR